MEKIEQIQQALLPFGGEYTVAKINWACHIHILHISTALVTLFQNQRTNGPVNAHLISGPTVSTKTSKIGQGQPRVIIYINFVDLESPMLHPKFPRS